MSNPEIKIPYQAIVPIFQKPEVRKQLRSNIRYNRYRVDETPERFANLLGDDIRFVSHPGVTYNLTERFIYSQNSSLGNVEPISTNEAATLLTASIIHDWGEIKLDGHGHGDITFDQHTRVHDEEENSIFDNITSWISDEDDRILLRNAYNEIVLDKTSKLGRMFNAIERVGYLNTAMRAYTGRSGERIKNWHGLVGNVLSNQITSLLLYSKEYPYVRQILEQNALLISQAFDDVPQQEILEANDGKSSYRKELFELAASAWKESTVVWQ